MIKKERKSLSKTHYISTFETCLNELNLYQIFPVLLTIGIVTICMKGYLLKKNDCKSQIQQTFNKKIKFDHFTQKYLLGSQCDKKLKYLYFGLLHGPINAAGGPLIMKSCPSIYKMFYINWRNNINNSSTFFGQIS